MPTADLDSDRRGTVRIVLIVATALYGLSLLPAAFAAVMLPMAFDAGPSREAVFLASAVLAYPVLVLTALVGGWTSYVRRMHKAAMVFVLLPLVEVLVLLGTVV